jgi:integrase
MAVQRGVSASTQNQARAALIFLYRCVINAPLCGVSNVSPAKTRVRVPNVLEKNEVEAVLGQLEGAPRLVVMLLYGAGMRLNEALGLRLKDIDAGRHTVVVRAGKGNKDRRSVLPKLLIGAITEQMQRVRTAHLAAVARGRGYTALPPALARKMPNAVRDWRWSWLFPAARDAYDRDARRNVRYPMHATTVRRAIAMAAFRAGVRRKQASDCTHLPAFLRDASAARRLRHPDCAGAPRSSSSLPTSEALIKTAAFHGIRPANRARTSALQLWTITISGSSTASSTSSCLPSGETS